MEHWDRLEKLLGEIYGRETDNEENIWRSPPFFSATLAVEVAVVTLILVAATAGPQHAGQVLARSEHG